MRSICSWSEGWSSARIWGPILLQLPPDMPRDLDALEGTLDAFPPDVRIAVEPRHRSWFVDDLAALLRARGAALCHADRGGPLTPPWRTADWTYVRFHGGRSTPRPCYGERALRSWASRIAEIAGDQPPDGFAFFNNDHHGCALRDASRFGRVLMGDGVAVGRVPHIDDAVLEVAQARCLPG